MAQIVRFQEILRRLTIIDEGFAEDQALLGLGLPASQLLGPKTAALVQVGALMAIGSRGAAWNGAPPGRWRRARPKRRSPACCWRSPRRPGSAGSPAPSSTWRPRSGTTLRPR
jgi:hypothetical protein